MRRGAVGAARAAIARVGLCGLCALPGPLALAARAAAEAPPCRVSSSAPARAFVGEQIVLEIRVLRRPDVSSATWIDGSRFPGFRSDPLPGLAGETRVREDGAAYLVFAERHALFAVRAGRQELPAARLQCVIHSLPGAPPRAYVAALAPRSIDVVDVPAADRPPGYTGLVGRVELAVEAAPRELTLGETLHLTVSYAGDADLRSLPPPFGGAGTLGAAELFPARPKLQVDPGARLRLRRTFAFDVVPRESGTLRIPAVTASFFDPARLRFGEARTLPLEIRVKPPGGG